MQVLCKGEQFKIGGGYGVLAVHARGYGELTVWARPAHEPQRLIRQGQIIVNKFLNFSGLFRGRAGKRGLGGRFFLVSFELSFLGQNEPLLRGWRPATCSPGPMAASELIPAPANLLGTPDAGETLPDVRADHLQDWLRRSGASGYSPSFHKKGKKQIWPGPATRAILFW
jgi:hypothetical protein